MSHTLVVVMSKLALFRIIGESFATTSRRHATRKNAQEFFDETAERMYPENEHRREWALSNMELFYDQEIERMQIMDTLRGYDGRNVLDQIRKRKGIV